MIAEIFKRRTLKKQALDQVWDEDVPSLVAEEAGEQALSRRREELLGKAGQADEEHLAQDNEGIVPEDKIVTLGSSEEGETLVQEALLVEVADDSANSVDLPETAVAEPSELQASGLDRSSDHFGRGEPQVADDSVVSSPAEQANDSLQVPDSATRKVDHLEAVPSFRLRPPQAPTANDTFDRYRFGVAEKRLWDAFTPSQPKRTQKCFAGRREILQRIISAIEEECINVAVFGARGIGKTSIAHVVAEAAKEVDYHVLRFACSTETTYESLFRGILAKIPAENMDRALRAQRPDVTNFSQLLPADGFNPTDVAEALGHLMQEHYLLIIDEFERIADLRLRGQLMETIKHLSDIGGRTTFLILGIADSLRELVGDNPLMQRHILGVHLPLMERAEVAALVDLGEAQSGMTFQPQIKNLIVSFSAGLPYFAQLVSLHAACFASRRGSNQVEVRDLKNALHRILNEAPSDLVTGYGEATWGVDGQVMAEVLYAASSCQFDRYGSFVRDDVLQVLKAQDSALTDPTQLEARFVALTKADRGGILLHHSRPGKEDAYIFRNHMMRQYILLRHAKLRNII